MVTPPEDFITSQSVTIDDVDGKWVVTVVETDGSSEREFAVEAFARSFAEGQRYRLGLAQAAE